MKFKSNVLMQAASLAFGGAMLLGSGFAGAVTLRIANQGDAMSLDPHSLNESLQITVNENVYEPLIWRDKNFKLTPALATDWKATNPTTWRFNLRKGWI